MPHSRSPRRTKPDATEDIAGMGDLQGIDFAAQGREQRAEFVDSRGGKHAVFVYLPKRHPGEASPAAVYCHSLAYESPLLESCRQDSDGMQLARSDFVLVSPIVRGIKDKDAYLTTELGEESLSWMAELVHRLAADGLPGPEGMPRVDSRRLAVTGVSLGGALTYMLTARCADVLRCSVPVAAYHSPKHRETIAEGLAKLPVLCVHSVSPSERTCPIGEEIPLWESARKLGGSVEVKEVHCKHGKTFSHAYEIDAEVWQWILKQ